MADSVLYSRIQTKQSSIFSNLEAVMARVATPFACTLTESSRVHMTVRSWTATSISESSDAAQSCPHTAVLKRNAVATHGNSKNCDVSYFDVSYISWTDARQTEKMSVNEDELQSCGRTSAGEVIPLL